MPLTDDGVWLVEQFRHPVGERFWEFPQGAWEDATPASAEALARGELAEETGLRAGRLEHLGRLYFAYGMSDQSVDVWRATDLERRRAGARIHRAGPDRAPLRGRRGRADDPLQRDPRRGVRGGVAPGGAPAATVR